MFDVLTTFLVSTELSVCSRSSRGRRAKQPSDKDHSLNDPLASLPDSQWFVPQLITFTDVPVQPCTERHDPKATETNRKTPINYSKCESGLKSMGLQQMLTCFAESRHNC